IVSHQALRFTLYVLRFRITMQTPRRVVITGLGALAPVGNSVPEIWRNLLAGKSGLNCITQFDATDFAIKVVGEVKDFSAEGYVDPKEVGRMDRSVLFSIVAAKQAVEDARLDISEEESHD